ncbi:UbiX family flavin prenyltransferase [Azorhizobium doebereinerae]|uniref:UbiX family flavin prenyltransferase n=1 Tax=Azorhizobium doebereinerae TaxID=281091 RepID=UPI00040D59F1|nr:UbiX family flavin prenyltransferase [Azorhizobium doebereinerae]
MEKDRVVVGITGASGFQYGLEALRLLNDAGVETHLVMSKGADLTRQHETSVTRAEVEQMAAYCHAPGALGAPISSGSFRTLGMIIAPCSMHTLGAIASGVTDNLVTRAADVVLKERRRLVLMARETPLHLGHLRNMQAVTEYGAIVFPPVPAIYAGPKTTDDIIRHSVARAIGLLGIHTQELPRWGETVPALTLEK